MQLIDIINVKYELLINCFEQLGNDNLFYSRRSVGFL